MTFMSRSYLKLLSSFLLISTILLGAGCQGTPGGEYHVAAYYWPAYHDGPRWRPFFRGTGPGGNEGEWEIIRKAKPKFDGHHQPHVPLWGYEDATVPKVMEKKIDAAVDHGVDIMIFDWYWYNNKPFLEEEINKGFLKAKNNDKN